MVGSFLGYALTDPGLSMRLGIGLGIGFVGGASLPQLTPPGDSTVQTIPDFTGSNTGHLHTGHLIWLPDALTIDGHTWSYTEQASYPVIYVFCGQGATPTTMASNTLAQWKTGMTNAQIPPCIIVYPNTEDSDGEEGWGMNSADGSYPLETMMTVDLPAYIEAHTRAASGAANRVVSGFSKGGYEALRLRAKLGAGFAAAYVVAGAPRLDADFPTAAATYANWTAAEKAKLFNNDSAISQAQSPVAHTALTGLFNVYGNNAGGAGAAPLLMLESDPGDTTASNSMNNMINTRLAAVSVSFDTVNLDDATHTPTHSPSLYWTSWVEQATTNMSWITTNTGWAMP